MRTIKKLFAICFALIAFSSYAALTNPIGSSAIIPEYPVIFVHGIASNGATFQPMIGALDDENGTYTGGRLIAWSQPSGSLSCSWRGGWDDTSSWVPVSSQFVPANKRYFAIDFSDSNDLTFVAQARELKTVIDCVKSLTGTSSVMIVGHSMGGIAARYYMQNLTFEWASDVRKLVTIDTPHSGALPEVYGCVLPGLNLLSGLKSDLWCGHTAVGELAPRSFSIRKMNSLAATTNPLPSARYTVIRARNASPTFSIDSSGNDGIVPFDSQSLRLAIAPAAIPDVLNRQIGDDWIFDCRLTHTCILKSDKALHQIRLEVAPDDQPKPWALTGSYTGLSSTAVTLNGNASSAGFAGSDLVVEWGGSPALGNIAKQTASSGFNSMSYAFSLDNLSPGSKVYYRFFIRMATAPFTVYRGKVESVTLPLSASATLSTPTGLMPSNGSTSQPLRATLSWSAVTNATSYRVMIAETQSSLPTSAAADTCTSCVANFEPTQPVTTFSSGTLAPGKTYFWKVKGRSPEQVGDWSSTFSFTTAAASNLPAPLLTSPVDQSVTPNTQPTLQWAAVSGASSYRVLIAETASALSALTTYDPLCAGCVVNTTTADTAYTLPSGSLITGKSYFWRVKARSATQYGELSSPIRSFAVAVASGACSYALSPSPTLGVVATSGAVTVAVSTQSGCAINITSSPSWLVASAPSAADVSGYAAIALNVQANTNAASRSAVLTVNGQTVNIVQSGTAPATSYAITVVQGANGTATPSDTTSYGANQQVTLTATPANSGYLFSGWKESGSFVSFNSTWTFNATQNRTITAEFIASRIAQNVQMNGADEYARWRVYPGPDAWSTSSDYVSLAPNQYYDLICSDTPNYYANPGKVTWYLGATYNGPFACNYLPKAGGGALNLPIASQARIAVDTFNYLVRLPDSRVAVWGAACQAAPGNGHWIDYCDGVSNMLLPQVVPGSAGASAVSTMNPNNGKLLAKLSAGGWSSWRGASDRKLSPSAELSMQDIALVRGTLAIKTDGSLWTISQDAVLAPVDGITNVVDAARGGRIDFALRRDGVVVAINNGYTIPVGIDFDDYTNFVVQPRPPLAPLPSLNKVVSIAGTTDNMFAVRQDGTVWVWGYSGAAYGGAVRPTGGQTAYRPVQVPGINGATAVVASYRSVYVLLANGGVVAWVGNGAGQLGRGTVGADDGTPTIIPGLSNVTELAAAINGVLAVKTDGTVWSWGANGGQSPGNGLSAATQSTPVQVLCPKGFSGFLNLNTAASCSANTQFTVKVDKKAVTVPATVKVNGTAVTLPYTGQFSVGTSVTLESEYSAGNDAGYWQTIDTRHSSRVVSLPTNVDTDIQLWGGSCANQFATYLTSNFNINLRAFTAVSSGDLLNMSIYLPNRPSCHWKFTSAATWIRAVNGDGYGPSQYQIQVDPNPTNLERIATFYLADPAAFSLAAHTITQAASTSVTTPIPFAFTSIGGYPISTQAEGSTLISGINAPSPVSVTNGSHSVGCTGAYTTAASTIANGQTLCVRVTSAPTAATTVTVMATVGGVSAPFNVSTAAACNLNVSGTGTTNAADGLLVMRYLLGFRGASLISGVTPPGAPTNFADSVVDRIGALPLDLDGNGSSDALTDGLMYHRLTSGLIGSAVTNGAIGLGASRADWAAIQAFVNPRCGTNF